MYSRRPGIPNFHANNEAIFRLAIREEKFELANWLVKICDQHNLGHIDIHYNNNEAFRFCCGKFKTHEMAKWLYKLSLAPPYTRICIADLRDQIMTDYKGKMRRMLEVFLETEFNS